MTPLRVLLFGTYERSRVPRVDILTEGLTAHGHVVATCNEPLPLDPDERLDVLRHPWRLHRLLVPLARAWWRLGRRSRREARPDVVVVGYMGHFDVHLARLLFRRSTIVLDHLVFAGDTAVDRGGTRAVQGILRLVDRAALGQADLVIVDTEEHHALLPARTRSKALVVPVGAPGRWFDIAPTRSADGRLRVVFFGIFTPLQGTTVIADAILALRADGSATAFTMVGTGQDHAAVRETLRIVDGVDWIDWVEPHDLPRIVAHHDVCLGVFGTSDKARRVVPNKVFQACAAGRAVITSDTPPQRRTLADAVLFVPPGDPTALAACLRHLADDRARVASLQHRARCLAQRKFRPDQVTAELSRRLAALAQ